MTARTRRRVLVALLVIASFLALAPAKRAGACTVANWPSWCGPSTTTSTTTTTTSTTRPAPSTSSSTTTRVGFDIVIPDPPTTTVHVIDLPPVVVEPRAVRAPAPAEPVVAAPRFAG